LEEFLSAGGELNPDGTITLYHATRPEIACDIVRAGKLRVPEGVPDSYGVYASSSFEHVKQSYGGAVVQFHAPIEDLHPDDVAPGRWLDFRLDTRGGAYLKGSNFRLVS
jgi:hypothetical protein